MATSRTGTATYLRNSKRVKTQARRSGLTHCPGVDGRPCGAELDYDTPLLPNSAETDHIIPHGQGGTDDADNLRVICRKCNGQRNRTKVPVPVAAADDFPVDPNWLALVCGGGEGAPIPGRSSPRQA
ncbi:HNH endonuclease [Georgenia sp. TF02-10]|uniref:HNH endonuclease n=1 Tax=Georgenia sp. TF02-10 TaxID=2917725 RepID=UPI001FA7DC6D|nr:HNH endonuclease [Georgenia sp. TF02-10]UNX54094.1 HNH endonuclease [Georgenia sp. TF02-10]